MIRELIRRRVDRKMGAATGQQVEDEIGQAAERTVSALTREKR